MNHTPTVRSTALSSETIAKLAASRKAAEKLEIRQIKCPICGFYLLDVYGRDHHLTRVKCRKCKFDDVIDTALFRTQRHHYHVKYHTHKTTTIR